jgi:hypothetical protein
MVVEMDMGIICGCLSGVKPVLARLLPSLFGTTTSYKTPTRPSYAYQSNAFHPLSDFHQTSSKQTSSTKKLEHAFSVQSLTGQDDSAHRNFAWASSDGDMRGNSRLPANAIKIDQVVEVVEGAGEGRDRKKMSGGDDDASSEEWIMGEGRRHGGHL